MINECLIGKNVERSGRGLFQGTIPAFSWKDWGNPRFTLVGVQYDVPNESGGEHHEFVFFGFISFWLHF
jgi:hypothetical protein